MRSIGRSRREASLSAMDPEQTAQLSFPRNYDVRMLGSADKALATTVHFSGVTDLADRDGLQIEVKLREGGTWIGTFTIGVEDSDAVTGVFSYPDSGVVCAVSGGQAYLVEAEDVRE